MIKKGFTLAEVLITLAILGVVAALTIPGLLANTQGRQYSVGYKKAVSTFGQAINKMVAMEGVDMSNWSDAVDYAGNKKYDTFVDFMEQNFNVQKVNGKDVYLSDGTAFRGIGNIPQTNYADGNAGGGCTAEAPCIVVVDTNGDAGPNRQTTIGNNGAPKVNDQFFMVITDVAAFPASNDLKDPDTGEPIDVINQTALGCTKYCTESTVTNNTAKATTFVMTGSTAGATASN